MSLKVIGSGFGRTGNWFGSQTLGIKPHIMTIAKGLSSGYAPIGGSIVCDEVAEVINSVEFKLSTLLIRDQSDYLLSLVLICLVLDRLFNV